MKCLLALLAASVMLVAMSCNHESRSEFQTSLQEVQAMDVPITDKKEEETPGGKSKNHNQQNPVVKSNADWDKRIVKTAVLNIEVTDFQKYNEQLHQLTQQWEGYIAKEEEKITEENIRNELTIKVPAARFDEAIISISGLNGKMLVKNVTTQDVTSEVFDTKTRMEAKKRIRVRYLDMLQKAKNMDEILQVEREINQIQEQIEAAEGRINYLTHISLSSTIELSFFQVLKPDFTDRENPGYAKRLVVALNDGFKWVANCIIFFATVWPVWIFLIILFIVLKKVHFIGVNTKN